MSEVDGMEWDGMGFGARCCFRDLLFEIESIAYISLSIMYGVIIIIVHIE